MKNFKVKVFLIAMILLITGGMVPIPLLQRTLATETSATGANGTDEFSGLLENEYESEAPKLDVAELSSTFTSEKEIEVFLTTTRNDISEIVISGWSGGAYSNFKTSKTAIYDETREIYTVTFNLDEIVNTNTNEIDNADEITFFFDACVYGENNTMSYYTLDDVVYTANGFTYKTETTEKGTTLNLNATEDGQVAILKAGEELTDETVWQDVTKGENSIALMSLNNDESVTDGTNETTTEGDAMSSDVQTYQIMYRSALTNQIATASVDVVSSSTIASSSTYVDDDTYNFEISQIDGLNGWTSYEDTPNIFESTIQGKHGETATATIKIHTEHAGILSFDYMSSSEVEFDVFSFEITGATLITEGGRSNTDKTKLSQTGNKDWKNFTGEFDIPSNGAITLTLKYKKDKNVNRYEDKAAIRNLIFTPILPSNGSVEINNGDEYTGSNIVNLKIYVEDATYMHISETAEKPSVNASTWLPLMETTTYTLKNIGDGEKKIYVWFKNDSNAMSLEPAIDTIKLDNAAPTTTAPTAESTATEIKVTLNQTDANELTVTEYGYRLANTSDAFTWSKNVMSGEYTITGLTKMQEYEVKTRVSDGINEVVESESVLIKTKIPSDKIVITSSPSEKTLDNVIVTITWNNEEGYEQEYSLNNVDYTVEPNTTTTIEMDKNGIIYYQMNDGTYETGVQIYNVGNIDREGPVVESVGVETPKSGKYGIGDEITIKVLWNEEIFSTELPVLNIKFNDNINIPLTAAYKITNEITYKYVIKAEDYGDLVIVSLEGGEIRDSLANVASYELPEQTGSEIFAENAAYIAATNTYYATIQNAVNVAGTEPTIIKVTANTELRNKVTIKENQNITLDLNGKIISYKSDDSIVTAIENSGTLVIKDTKNTIGEITAYSKERSAYTIINNGTGALTIENGKITAVSDSESVALKSYAIYDKEAGVVTLGINDDIVSSISPEIKATSKTSVGIKLVDAAGRLYYSDGIIKGTSESLELASGAYAYIMPVGYMEKIETQTEEYGIYKVSYLSNQNVVELTIDGKTEKYMTLIEALSRVPSDGRLSEIKMLADDTLQEIAKVYEGQNIVLDLNGHTITRNKAVNGIIYGILNNGTLTIKDTQGTGKIQAITDKDVKAYAVYNYTKGTLTLENVTLFAKNGGTNEAYGLDYTGDATSIIKLATETVKIYRDTLEKDKKYLNPLSVEGEKYLKQGTEIVDGITYKVNYGGLEPNASLTVNGTTSYYNSVQNAVNAVPTDGTLGEIQVLDDEELYTFIDIVVNKNVSIDLNGKTIINKGETQAIRNNGDLIIKDTNENQTGLIHSINNANGAYGITNGAKTLEINSGTIMGTSTLNTASGVFGINTNNLNGTIIINGGTFKGMTNGISIPAGMLINNSGDIQTGKVNLPQEKHLAYKVEDKYVVNYLADGEVVATLEQNGEITNYVSIQDAIYAVVADGTLAKITMHESESLGRTIEILEGQNVEIDLNGKEIYFGRTPALINNKGDLVINDSSNGEGKLTSVTNSRAGQLLNNAGTGTITINGGNISSKADVTFTTIYNASSGSIIINAGTVKGTLNSNEGRVIGNNGTGTIQINGGNITSNRNVLIINWNNGNIEVNGGNIKSNATAIENRSTGTVVINGGNIIANSNAIYNGSTGNIEVYGGLINSTGTGSVIYNNSKGKVIIGIDDRIIENEPIIIGRYAIYQRILGGEVYYYDGILKGTDAIVVYPSTTKFKANETPTEAYYLIMTTDDAYLKNSKEDSYYTISYSDAANYELSYTNGSENIVTQYATLKAAIQNAPESTKTKITVLSDSVEKIGASISKTQNILLDLNGKKVLVEEASYSISNAGILQIIDSSENGTGLLEGKNCVISQANLAGTVIIGEDDGLVTTTKPTIKGTVGAVINTVNSTVKMYDGKIIGPAPVADGTRVLANGYKEKIITLSDGVTKEYYLVKKVGITISTELSTWTNKDLNIFINYSDTTLTNQYVIDTENRNPEQISPMEWSTATLSNNLATISVSENCTIYAKSIDADDNVIYSEQYEIANIDKILPTVENVNITTGIATSQTITATGIKDNEKGSGLKSYIVTMDTEAPLDSAEWIENEEENITAQVTKNGTWYVYVKDVVGNVSEGKSVVAENIDIEAPIVTNIEVISPATGNYFMNEVITMQVNFSEEITVSGTPTLKIKFGEGEEKELTSRSISSNTITYTYTVQAEDVGQLTLVSYNGEGIKDLAGNDYLDTEIELIGSKIYVQTRAYIEATDTYYATLKEAIAACSTTATEYTIIKLIQNDYYNEETVKISAGQKITLDLNGKELNINGEAGATITAIDNIGDLIITDTSESKDGIVKFIAGSGWNKQAISTGNGSLQIDEGNISVIGNGAWVHGISSVGTGTVAINGGSINNLANGGSTYGINIKNANAIVIINGGELKGRSSGWYKEDGMIISNSGAATNGKITLPANKHLAYRLEDGYVVNYLEDGEYAVTLEINGEITKYLSLEDAVYAVPTDGTFAKIKIYENEYVGKTINIAAGKNIEIDLNGKSIYKQYSTVILKNNGDLRIIDSSEGFAGKIELVNYERAIENAGEGNLYINMGLISSDNNGSSIPITNSSNGSLIIDSAIINAKAGLNAWGIENKGSGTLIINGGTIVAEPNTYADALNGMGIFLNNTSAKVIITGGIFKGKNDGIYIPLGMKINNTGTAVSGEVNLPENKYIAYRTEDNYIVNYLEDGNVVASLEVNGETTNYLSIYDALADAPTDGTYAKIKMHKNVIITKTIEILEGHNIEIDLNGKELYSKIKFMNNNGNVMITDTSENKAGKIEVITDAISTTAKGTTQILGGYIKISAGLSNAGTTIISGDSNLYLNKINNTAGTLLIGGNTNIFGHTGRLIDNTGSANIQIDGGRITNIKDEIIWNNSTGNLIINDGILDGSNRTSYAIANNSTGAMVVNGGSIIAKNNQVMGFAKADSEFVFNGGRFINLLRAQLFNPTYKSVEIPENTYIKLSNVQSGDTSIWVGELDKAGDYELTVSGVGISYYNTLQEAINAAPTNGTFSKLRLLADCHLTGQIVISSNRYIQLDLNGHNISFYSNTGKLTAIYHDTEAYFEMIDTIGTGLIDVKVEGYDAIAIWNEYQNNRLKLINIKIKVTSIGGNAYGIINNSNLRTIPNESLIIDGGSISAKAEVGTNTATSGIACGISAGYNNSILIKGSNTEISATSALNDSYGIYNANSLTIGEKDKIANINSPHIKGDTAGIYTNATTINLYDGSITGSSGKAILSSNGNTNEAVVTDIEENTFVYTLNNNDGTETVMLLKNIESLKVEPDEIYSNDLSKEYILEVSYLPTDAGGVKIQVDMSDVNLASVNEIDDGVYSVRPKAEGSGEILVTATDLSGKALTQIIPVIIDSIPPTQTAPSATSTGSSVTITCNQEDENLDKNEIYYAISEDNGATWSTWSKRATINGLKSDTMYLVKTKASDLLGNVSESETTEIRTKLANNSKFTFNPDTMTRENVLVTITWNNPQGTPQYYKIGEDGEWINETNETTSITVEQNGVTVYTKLVYDGVEESDIKSTTVDNIDRIAPTGTLAINEAYPRYDGYVTLNLTTQDDTYALGDGLGAVAYMYITEENLSEAPAVDDEGWIKYEGDYDAYDYYIQATDGEVAIYVWLMDKAKNTSNVLVAETEFLPPVAVLFEDGELKGEFQSIKEACDEARTGNNNPSTIIVCQDTTITSTLTIANGKNIILDLNGRTVSSTIGTTINNDGKLEITDSRENGKILNTCSNAEIKVINNTRNLTISSGSIQVIRSTNYQSHGIYNNGNVAILNMTGGKIYLEVQSNNAYGIFNQSSYTGGTSCKVTGGTIEVIGGYTAYGIWNNSNGSLEVDGAKIIATAINSDAIAIKKAGNGNIKLISGNFIASSVSQIGYGVHIDNATNSLTIGTDDGIIRNNKITIEGSNYGVYRNKGVINFYDGTIKGAKGNSVVCQSGYITTPTNYGVSRTVENKVETATLMYDSYAPTIESFEVSEFENSNTQVITAKGVSDYGTGIVGYQFTTTATPPAVTDTKWIAVTPTNGPEEYSKTINTNGTHYFWAIDAAGNVSAVTSIEVNNIKVKANKVSLTGFTMEIGQENTLVATLDPLDAEPKNVLFTSNNESIAYVDPETGVVTGIKAGTVTMKVTVSNYDDTYAVATCQVTVTEPYVDIPETETAPTLETGYKQITVTCNQTGNSITATYYAISTDDFAEDIGEWQTSNVFTNLEEGTKYYVKTKIVSSEGEVESVSAMTIVPSYKASLEENGVVTYYESVQDAINAANTSGTMAKVTLLNTETRDTVVTVASGKNILLDLNGNDLVMVSTANAEFRGLTNNGTLEIIDSVGGGEIKASLTSTAGNYYVYGIYNDAGTLTVKGGTITGTNPESKKTYARGICNVNNAIAIIGEDDGNISTTTPKITSNGIGIFNSSGTMYVYDGLMIGNKGTATSGTIKVADSYCLKSEDTDVQTTVYLVPIVIDDSKAMIMTWNIPAGATVKLPISSATNMNVKVDWGDGKSNQYINQTFPTHTYTEGKEYIIKVEGTCATWGYANWNTPGSDYSSYNNYLIKLNSWGELGATQYGFAFCTNLNYVSSDVTEKSLENMNTMFSMFFKCESLTSLDLSKFDTSKVTSLQSAFEKCIKLNSLDISMFNTSKVTTLESLVYGCTNLNDLKLGNIDTSKVTTTRYMIRDCTNLEYVDLSGLNLSKVTNTDSMFINDKSLKSILVNETFVVPTTSGNMFNNNTSLKAIILTSKEPTAGQFTNAVSKLPSQTIFYVPNASEIKYQNAWSEDYSEERIEPILELVGEENVVANIRKEFVDEGCTVADITVDNSGDYTVYGYEVNTNEDFDHTVEGNHVLTYTLTRTYNNGTKDVTEEVAKVRRNVEAIDLDAYMITEWTIPSGEVTITLPVSGAGLNITIDWGDGSEVTTWTDTTKFPTHTYTESGEYDIKIRGTCPKWGVFPNQTTADKESYKLYITGLKQWGDLNATQYQFQNCTNLKYVSGDATENTFTNVTTMQSMFEDCTRLENIDLGNFNTISVKNMASMFRNCDSLVTIDVSSFDTTYVDSMLNMFSMCDSLENIIMSSSFNTMSVTDMRYMFSNNPKIKELDLTSFNTSNVKSMNGMFQLCTELETINWDKEKFNTSSVNLMGSMFSGCGKLVNLDVSGFNTENVSEMGLMFGGCNSLTNIDVSNFNTESVTHMGAMFRYCTSLEELDVSNFDTSSVKDMSQMFYGCRLLTTIDVSDFDTGKATKISQMFGGCDNLVDVDVSGFNTENVTDMNQMFYNCGKLESLDLTNFNTEKVTLMSGMFNGCSSLKSLDLSSFDTQNVTDLGEIFYVETDLMMNNCKNLKSILISDKFVISGDTKDMFKSCNNLSAIITTSTTPVANQFKGMLPSTATLYVPNGSEEAYAYVLNGDTDASQIAPILQVSGKDKITVLQNSEYSDEGYTIAGFTKTQLEEMNPSGDASLYGYKATTSGDVDTSTLGEYEVEYTMNRTDKEGNLLAEPTTVARMVIVVDAPIVIVYEEGIEYDGEWTQNSLTVLVETLAPNTDWIQLKLGEGEWTENPEYTDITTSGDKLTFILTETMTETIYVREVDVSGTATSNSTKGNVIKIDKVKPVIEEAKSKTIDQEVYVKADVSDVGSGVAYFAVTLTEDETRIWEECTVGTEEILHKLDKTGTYYLWIKDEAGMVSEAQILKAIKDVKAPEGSISIVEKKEYSGDKYTNEGEVTININVTDNESEPEETKFALYNEEDYMAIMAGTKEIVWQDYAPSVTWPLKEGEGLNRIYVFFKDLAGNVR